MWTLKKNQPSFEVVDGPMAGKTFVHGEQYEEIPVGSDRFDKVKKNTAPKAGNAPEEVVDA